MGKKNSFLTLTALAAFCAFAFVRCDRPVGREPISWASAIDIPINFSVEVGGDLDFVKVPAVDIDLGFIDTNIVMNLHTETLSVFDQLRAVQKLTRHRLEYNIDVNSKTQMENGFSLYALFVPQESVETLENMGLKELYELITGNDELDLASKYRYISLFGRDGLKILRRGVSSKSMANSPVNDSLCSVILNSKSCGWRWIAKIDKDGFDSLNDTGSGADIIDISVRFRFSGVNNSDSLLGLY